MNLLEGPEFSDRLEVFFGSASAAACRVYARLPGLPVEAGYRLRGKVAGPECQFAHTLKAAYDWVERGGGESLLAEAFVPEPCVWTPQLPQLYESQIELVCDQQVLAVDRRLLGLRTLGASGRNLYYQAQRWVLRAVEAAAVTADELPAYRQSETALVVPCPEDALCAAASRAGVLIVARLSAEQVSELRRLSRWPAVGIVALPAGLHLDLHGWRHNLLLAQWLDQPGPPSHQPWAQMAILPVEDPAAAAEWIAGSAIPAIAARIGGSAGDVPRRRGLCDRLQRDLAMAGGGRCDPAGYIV